MGAAGDKQLLLLSKTSRSVLFFILPIFQSSCSFGMLPASAKSTMNTVLVLAKKVSLAEFKELHNFQVFLYYHTCATRVQNLSPFTSILFIIEKLITLSIFLTTVLSVVKLALINPVNLTFNL